MTSTDVAAKPKLTIVSGRSGSGKSVALRVLEDLGHYCVDNLPVAMLPTLVAQVSGHYSDIAVSIDVRNLPEDPHTLETILDLLCQQCRCTVLFMDAQQSALIQRFSETRRLHPLSKHGVSLEQAIEAEQRLLEPLISRADLQIDSSQLSIHQLSDLVRERLLGNADRHLVLVFESFGFKYGIPQDADYVFDARFLPNPHWEPELRPMTGLDAPVEQFFSRQPIVAKFIWQINNLLNTWLPHLELNNRSYVTVAIGCTGGQHRSVFIAETLAKQFKELRNEIQIRHRELGH
ncbi:MULTISPECIES: RNase adapter RapZ [Corallincola]|uniref:RNase adapter RapZ n=3 Tax=Corallincola TaxID=1775176 RepID=A0A368NHB2_9GAMM|nr:MULTISPECIES: RNase adapter RapZ [Corallincola]RCU49848.1 RNase adapter RapZ [Corallincola holothuriorum]TAA45175.1 RNase adapter RapZ [Corallincola spongiicola]TCI03548.1 RNase adapter RapZ [Corallincola luteus]